jgi:hypothetical protein
LFLQLIKGIRAGIGLWILPRLAFSGRRGLTRAGSAGSVGIFKTISACAADTKISLPGIKKKKTELLG